ncbi:hypothetical protein Vadar_027569 [Vaccinium darrowii]|uniref:Uncharacterized protein n=1 Tax=Vaccinium darrowii TaxID=229202 RepID=A0ACB7YZJ5_9ERIC|nr:hypothetical protein Vadar_027569 [Vaccinium darrowii]
MQKKQLDLDQPLLSVRRFSSKLASSKELNKKKTEKSLPHRQQSLPVCKSDWELEQVTKPAAVPFTWEQIPGKAKGENQSPLEPSNTPRLPPGRACDTLNPYEDRSVFKPQIHSSPIPNEISTLWESLKKTVNAEGDACDSESEGDDYSDALDTLSPTDTVSMKCSGSGLSGFGWSDRCGNFSADTQTKDFMMNRFLPAAKAMVLDTPQYGPKKQPMTPDRPRPVKKVVSGEMKLLHEQKCSVVVPYNVKHKEGGSEEEEDEPVNTSKKTVKAFGLFSRFCLKNSLCLLNPVPGMKVRTKVPNSSTKEARLPPSPSAKEVNRMARTSHSGPLPQSAEKKYSGALYRNKLDPRSRSQELHKVRYKPSGETNRLSCSGDLQMMKGTSPSSRFLRGGISPYRNRAPPSPFREGVGFLGVANGIENFKGTKDVSGHQRYKPVSGSIIPAVEKTLYVDSVNIVEQPLSDSISSRKESLASGKDFSTSESFLRQMRHPDIFEGGSISMALVSVDNEKSSSARIPNVRSQEAGREGWRLDQGRDHETRALDCLKLDPTGIVDANKGGISKEDDQGNLIVGSMLSPLPPPLPKSPSESWLWKTLPSIALWHQKKQRSKESETGTKWETIVKTSNVHHDHARYSEELVPHVSQHSKT